MTIFALSQEVNEEGDLALVGLFSTLEAARAAAEVFDPLGAECLVIQARELDAPAVFDETFVECL